MHHSIEERDRPCRYLAHSANDEGAGVPELLCQHLQAVADRAAHFAAAFDAEEQAYGAGLIHDLGKYADQFLRRLQDPREPGRDHWSVGAALIAAIGKELGLIPAVAIAGHHAGLDHVPLNVQHFCGRLLEVFQTRPGDFTDTDRKLLVERYLADGFALPKIGHGLVLTGQFAADMLDIRMLFSALVDADFLETETHFNGDVQTPRRPRPDGPTLNIEKGIAALEEYLGRVRQEYDRSPMAASREALYDRCLEAAERPTGLFSLSAPTGAGKTLAMLAFALHHAWIHGLRRLVLVMPFLNIIEQTASIYRSIFSPDAGFAPYTVLEHHSLVHGHIATSLRDRPPLEAIRMKLLEGKARPTELATLAVAGADDTTILVERADWHGWWQAHRAWLLEARKTKATAGRRRKKAGTAAVQPARMRCLLSGELVEPLPTHNKIEGLSDVGGLPRQRAPAGLSGVKRRWIAGASWHIARPCPRACVDQ